MRASRASLALDDCLFEGACNAAEHLPVLDHVRTRTRLAAPTPGPGVLVATWRARSAVPSVTLDAKVPIRSTTMSGVLPMACRTEPRRHSHRDIWRGSPRSPN